jgi:hypothetical protein
MTKPNHHLLNFGIEHLRFELRILPNGAAELPFESNPIESNSKDYQENQGAHSKVSC